jgi:hypothetical protein
VQTISLTYDFKLKKAWISIVYPGFLMHEGHLLQTFSILGIDFFKKKL